jgi:hypothetical protein
MQKFFALVCAFALGAATVVVTPVSAQQVGWRVTAREGVVRVREPGQDLSDAVLNQRLRPGTTLTTGADSRVTVENGAQRIVMTPNSRMTIAAISDDGMTRILQDLGSLLFQVDRRQAQHFRVETPLLAAVVKGTTFTVSVGPQHDMVHVSQGLVEVRANEGGAVSDVAAGVTARVARTAPGAIAMTTPAEPAGVVHTVAAPALDYAVVSDGVVQAASNGNAVSGQGRPEGSRANQGGQDVGAEGGAGGGSNLFGQSIAAVRNVIASLTGGNGNGPPVVPGGNGNGNGPPVVPGGNGNGNGPPVVPGGNGNGNGNGPPVVPGGNGNGNGPPVDPGDNGNDPLALPVCRGRSCD